MAPLARVAALLVALVAVPTGWPASAVAPDHRADSWTDGYYYNDTAGYFAYVPTNGVTWKAQRITNTSSGMSPQPQTPEQFQGKVLEAIWEESCPATNDQKVKLTRKIQLPGALASLHVGLKTLVFNTTMHKGKNPFDWAEVRLNGSTLLRLDADRTPLDTWKAVDLASGAVDVRFGANTLSVVAKKRETKRAWDFCTSSTPDFGVAAEVYAVPTSELTSTIPTGSFAGQLTATVTNAGPSTMVGGVSGGQFWFRTTQPSGGATVTDGLGQVNGVTDSCSTSKNAEGVLITCPMPVLGPGESLKVDIYLTFAGTACPGTWKIPFGYKVSGLWRESNTTDNGQEQGRYLACSPQ